MSQSVLDGVVAIEAKAAKRIDDAKAQAKAIRREVEETLSALEKELDADAERAIHTHAEAIASRKQKAIASLDEQLAAALAALEKVRTEQLGAMVGDVVALLERGDDGH